MTETRDLVGTPYGIGGREPGRIIDCLGVCLVLLARMGIRAPDPWSAIRAAWDAKDLRGCALTGFAVGWSCIGRGSELLHGDVLLYFGGDHPWSAVVCDGYVWSATEELGPYCRDAGRWRKQANEHWRFGEVRAS